MHREQSMYLVPAADFAIGKLSRIANRIQDCTSSYPTSVCFGDECTLFSCYSLPLRTCSVIMAVNRMILLVAPIFLASLAVAAIPPESIAAFQAIRQPAPLPGYVLPQDNVAALSSNLPILGSTQLNGSSEPIIMRVPGSDISLTFRNYGKLLYQTDVSLCLLESASDLVALAIKAKGDAYLPSNNFDRNYGTATVAMNSYSPPTQRLRASHTVHVLRGIGFFMALYGYFEVDFDIFSFRDGHVGIGLIGLQTLES